MFSEVCIEESRHLVMLSKRNLNNTVENSTIGFGINASQSNAKKPDEKSRI